VEDIETLRVRLRIARWAVLGGSWGSALALAYAQAHPDRVSALIVSGVFLCRDEDIRWWWEGVRAVFPDVFAARDAFLSEEEEADVRGAFNARIASADPMVSGPAASILASVEAQSLDLWPPTPSEQAEAHDERTTASYRIFSWYDRNNFFIPEGQLLRDATRLSEIPGAIVAGRSDMCTPPKGAWDLAKAWPRARLSIVPAAGHRWGDEMLGRTLVGEIERLAG
jgi:proline iminopeptidase